MTAYLDTQRYAEDRSGGVSDPRLVRKLGAVPATTDEERDAATTVISLRVPEAEGRSTILAALGLAPITPAQIGLAA